MKQAHNYSKAVFWLIAISTVVRAFVAAWLELGNDEVYYWTYALYPDWSHYDHPPMVGWAIQLFSLNLLLDSEFFIRLSSIVIMGVNTWLMFRLGKLIGGEKTGLIAATLYTASIYAFVLTGIFILPDTPQGLFWMLSLFFMLKLLLGKQTQKGETIHLLLFGMFAGLSILSKYTGLFLWVGAGLYILFFERRWLKKPALYLSVLVSLVCILPVFIWNVKHDFISFSYHGGRVSLLESGLRFDFLAREIFGQVFYNNPFNYVMIVMGLAAVFKGHKLMPAPALRLLTLTALPLIGIFVFVSMFRATLPHWTGPAFNTLLLIAAANLTAGSASPENRFKIPVLVKLSMVFLAFIIVLGSLQIKFGLIPMPDKNPYHRLGRHDITLDLYGGRALMQKFEKIRKKHLTNGSMQAQDAIVAENWFALAKLDYYVARPMNMKVLGLGWPHRLNKYNWINRKRGGFSQGDNYWYLTNSRDYKPAEDVYAGLFAEIIAADTIEIMRGNRPAMRVFVYMLKGLQEEPEKYFVKYE
jgi:hypothetical protein